MSELVKKGTLRPHGSAEKIPCAITLDFSVIVSAKLGDVEMLTGMLQETADGLIAKCGEKGIEAFLRTGEVHPVTHDELLAVIPRKTHYAQAGRQICSTPFVSPMNLVTDDAAVTCKLCRKLRGLG